MRGAGKGTIETLPSGSHRASFRSPDGTRERRTFTDPDDAQLWLASKRIEVKRGIWQAPKPDAPPFGEFARAWIAQRRNRAGRPLKPRTRHEYERYLVNHLDEPFGVVPVDRITPAMVRAWYAGMDATPATQANCYGLLTAVLRTALADRLIEHSPCQILGGIVKDRATVTKALTPAEVHALAAHMPARYQALVLVAAYGALRFGEAAALRRVDVAPDGSQITVLRGVTFTPGQVHVTNPKSRAGIRCVSMPPHIREALVEHLTLWVEPDAEALVFTSGRGHMLRPSTLYKSFYPARASIGRPDLRWHDLRHTGGTLAAQAGATLAELQDRLGHSTIAAAMRYQHAAQGRDALLAERISQEVAAPRLRLV